MEQNDVDLTREKCAMSQLNRYYTWEALGKPDRMVTDEECRKHFNRQSPNYRVHIFHVVEKGKKDSPQY